MEKKAKLTEQKVDFAHPISRQRDAAGNKAVLAQAQGRKGGQYRRD